MAERLFQQHGISNQLNAVRCPCRGRTVIKPPRLTALVFVRQIAPIPPPQTIDLAGQTKPCARQLQTRLLTVVIGLQTGMKFSAGVDAIIGHTNLFNLLQVEEALAIGQSVE